MTARLDQAFAAVPRERFLPTDQRRFADVDRALPLGYDVTNSQPSTVRTMLALLDPAPGDRVLDVGCGSGWTTALLADLVRPGSVVGVEIIPEVLSMCASNVGEVPGVELHLAEPGVLGWPAGAPYDRILVSADAADLSSGLVGQLAPHGVMVGPVRGMMLRVRRSGDAADGPSVEEHGRYVFVPLRGS